MRKIFHRSLPFVCLALVVLSAASLSLAAEIGERIAEFTLPDMHGRDRSLAEFADRELVIVAFLGTDCPLARLYAPRLQELSQQYADKKVALVAIDSNSQDSLTDLVQFANQFKVTFPLLKDRDAALADRFGARRTPEVFVLDRERAIRYRGRVDDQYGTGNSSGYAKTAVKDRSLATALDDLLAGRAVSQPTTEAMGCLIGRIAKAEPRGDITYAGKIAAIMEDHCIECHRPGQIGPFALTEYSEVAGWGQMLKEVVSEGRMPPWSANPEFGVFKNDCRLSADEQRLLFSWVDNGCPAGDLATLPAPRPRNEGWQIGKPDQVLTIARQFTVPAEGVLDYQNFIVDPGWTEGKWIQAAEARPGNRGVVHHIIISAIQGGEDGQQFSSAMPGLNPAALRGAGGRQGQAGGGAAGGLGGLRGGAAPGANPAGGLAGLRGIGGAGGAGGNYLEGILDSILGNAVTIFVPGYTGTVHEQGTAYWVPAGSKISFQLHYTPNGAPAEDQSSVGFVFADPAKVKKQAHTLVTGNPLLSIPPRTDNYKVTSKRVVPKDHWLLSLSPHMHARGKSFRYEAQFPDGHRETLLDVPKYDFNWQIDYKLAEPKLLPAGTVIECTAYFDNSEGNPSNPNPNANVRFGMQTWEEMMIGFYSTISVEDDAHLAAGQTAPPAAAGR